MREHPIQGLMNTAMQSISEMVDVNTIVGDPVSTPDGAVIIPVSKVAFGFAAGGGEYGGDVDFSVPEETIYSDDDEEKATAVIAPVKYPFAGGSGAGVSITPVAFLVVNSGNVKLLPVNTNTTIEKLIDMVPGFINKVCESFKKDKESDYPLEHTESEAF